MDHLTETGRSALEAAASRHGFSQDAARAMLDALVAGGGSQAQFSHPEFGGMGQWSRGGMIMIGDMFNNGLKYRVDALANDLSGIATDAGSFAPPPPGGARGGSNWWPDGLGWASSVGGQNDMRYAIFPDSRRLAVDRGGRVTVYDTGDHAIGGASQQQGGGQNLSFSSQYGTVTLDQFRIVDGEQAEPQQAAQHQPSLEPAPPHAPAFEPAPQERDPAPVAPAAQSQAPSSGHSGSSNSSGDPLALLERLSDLRTKGVISDEEFAAKKAEILSRL
jgi:hypothetical protein